MDEQKLNELIFEIRKLVETYKELGGTRGADTGQQVTRAFDRSSERLVRALGSLASSMKSQNQSTKVRTQEIEDFVRAIDQATDAAQEQSEAAAERVAAEERAATAAKERAAVEAEIAARMTWTQKQREDFEKKLESSRKQEAFRAAQLEAKQQLYNFDRERNYAQELAEVKLREIEASKSMHARLGRFGDYLSQTTGTDLVKTHMALLTFTASVGKVSEIAGTLGKSLLSLGGSVSTGFNNFNQFNVIVDSVASTLSKMGASIPFFGAAMVLVGEGAKFMLNQMQRVSDSFNGLAQVGGLASDGMDGVNRQFLQSGLTLEAMTKQVTANSQALAQLGGTVAEGTDRFTKLTGSIIDSDVGLELRSIGFSSEQIADVAAGFLTQQARLGRAQRMSQDELRAGTIKYTKELDQIARLTGLQREEVQKRMDAALSEQRFRAKMNELERTGRGDVAKQLNLFQAAVSESAPGLAQGLRDIIAAGGAVTTDAARQAFQLTGGQIVGIAQRALSGEDVGASLQGLAQSVQTGVQNYEKIAQFSDVSPIIGDFAQASDFASKGLNNFAETLNKIRREQETGMTAPTELTKGTVKAQKEMEELSRAVNAFSIALMPKAAGIVDSFATTLNDATKKIAQQLGIDLPTIKKGAEAAAAAQAAPASTLGVVGGVLRDTGNMNYGQAAKGVANLGGRAFNAIGRGAASGLEALGATGLAESMRSALAREAQDREKSYAPRGTPAAEVPGNQSTSGLPPGKTLSDILNFTAPSGTQQAFMSLDPTLRERVIKAAVEYNAATGGGRLTINSAYRSPADQKRLYEESIRAGREGFTASNMPIAKPGDSPHEKGLAVDIQEHNNPAAMAALNRAGLYNRVRGDPVHFHMQRGGIARGPNSGYPATLHGIEAVVPLPNGRSIPVDFDRQFQEQVRQIVQDNAAGSVNFAEIARRSDTNQRALDRVTSTIIPEIRAMMRETTESVTAAPTTATADTAAIDRIATRLTQELARSINNIMSQQTGTVSQQSNLLERMVDLQNRNVSVAERLLRVSQG